MTSLLSTQEFLNCLRCPRMAWLLREQESESASPPASYVPHHIDRLRARQCATGLFDGPVLEHGPLEPSAPCTGTAAGAVIRGNSYLFEADLMRRNRDGSWDLWQVQPSARIRYDHLRELAYGQHVLSEAGFEVRHAGIIYVNGTHCRREYGEDGPESLFFQEDCMDRTVELLDRLPSLAGEFHLLLNSDREPRTEPGPQCRTAEPCPFERRCRPDRPEHWVGDFYRMSQARRQELLRAGYTDIREIPDGEKLTPLQSRIRKALRTGQPFLAQEFAERLNRLGAPLHYLDFETFSPAIPPYPGTRPFELIPFQWSLHTETAGGNLEHRYFLADGGADPRPEFARSLLAALPPGSILTYTNYESQVLRSLKTGLPGLAEALEETAGRCVDLCALVRKHLYHPSFGQGFSLKKVLPALAPELTYGTLDVRDGLEASRTFLALTMEPDEERRCNLRKSLLDYCERDTLALVMIKRYVLKKSPARTPQ